MLTRFNRLKVVSAVSAALLAVSGCGGDSGTSHSSVTPTVNDADINPWLKVKGDWVLSGAGHALQISATQIDVYQFNQAGCVKLDGFDLVEGLANYALIEKSAEGKLLLQSVNSDRVQYYRSQALPESCAEPIGADADSKVVFDYLWYALGDFYAHFSARDIDWQGMYEGYASQVSVDSNNEELLNVLAQVIALLQDANVVLTADEASFSGHKTVPLLQAAKAMVNNALVYGEQLTQEQAVAQLKGVYTNIQKSYVSSDSWQQWPVDVSVPSIAWGLSANNVGLIVVNDVSEVQVDTLVSALTGLANADGIVIDMRNATGVNSQITDVINAHFVATNEDTHQSIISNGSSGDEQVYTHSVTGSDSAYQNPVYVLVSQATSGAAERLALVLKSQSHIKLVGEHTSGTVSQPMEVTLPNGWQLSLPHEVSTDITGNVLSVTGITPDIMAPAYTQTSTRDGKFESYRRALIDMGKYEFPVVAVADYEAQMNQFLADGKIPGAAVAVVKGGQVVYSQGFGRADENGREVTADTPFYIASISKTLLGTTIAQAEAADLLSVDDKIEDSLSFDVGYPVYSDFKPNLKHLMTHTAGLSDDGVIDLCAYFFEDDHTSLANWLLGQPLCEEPINPSMSYHLAQYFDPQGGLYKPTHFSSNYGVVPGTVNRYSNYGAALAAQSLEAATGRTLTELTNEFVINPLGMTNTLWSIDGVPVDAARRYYVNADGEAVPLKEYRTIAYPAGDGVSTANDLAKYMASAMNEGVYQGEQKLNADAVDRMLSSQSDVPTTERGVGYFWRLDGDYFFHNGGNFGVLSDAWADTHHDVAVVLLTNGDVMYGPAITSMIGMFAASKAFAYGLDE